MTAFVKAMGGTAWAGSQTQYYETVNGQNINIQNPTNVFGGVWYDDTNPIHNNVTGLELAKEAHTAASGRPSRISHPPSRLPAARSSASRSANLRASRARAKKAAASKPRSRSR